MVYLQNVLVWLWGFLFLICCQGMNVALNKTTTQLASLDYAGFIWTADKAVDGCTNQDNPDTEMCCSSSVGDGANNYWKVDLGQQYTVGLITVYGRNPDGGQLSGFEVYTMQTDPGTEMSAFTQKGQYEPGIFNITLNPARTVRSVVVKRPAGEIITLCEIEVYDFSITSTAPTTTSNMTSSNTTVPSGQGMNTGASIFQPKIFFVVTYIMFFFILDA